MEPIIFFLSFEEEPEKSRIYQYRKILIGKQSGLFLTEYKYQEHVYSKASFLRKGSFYVQEEFFTTEYC